MIIVKQQGRLGNQMFEYALAKQLCSLGKQVKMDCEFTRRTGVYNELRIFPNIDFGENKLIQEASKSEINTLGDFNRSLHNRIRRRLFGCKKTYIKENESGFEESIFHVDVGYLEGYWQSEKYFKDIAADIRNDFIFPELQCQHDKDIKQKIDNSNSVSLHVRRGDYLKPDEIIAYGNICTPEYYQKAIAYFLNCYSDVRFFIFTDDKPWSMNTFRDDKLFYIVDSSEAYVDMQLMSCCKHNIIANSSFSWWGAWLNSSAGREVLAPPVWMNDQENRDIWCESWKKIN